MPNKRSLAKYFKILLEENQQVDKKHELKDKKARFVFYKTIQSHIKTIISNLEQIKDILPSTYPGYINIVEDLLKALVKLSKISTEDMDNYIRMLGVERLIYKAEYSGKSTDAILNYLIEGLINLFFENQETDSLEETLKALKEIKDKKDKKLFSKKDDGILKQHVEETLENFEQVEQELVEAKHGVVAQDKEMLDMLQLLKQEMNMSSLVDMAVEREYKSKKGKSSKRVKFNFIKAMLKTDKDGKEYLQKTGKLDQFKKKGGRRRV